MKTKSILWAVIIAVIAGALALSLTACGEKKKEPFTGTAEGLVQEIVKEVTKSGKKGFGYIPSETFDLTDNARGGYLTLAKEMGGVQSATLIWSEESVEIYVGRVISFEDSAKATAYVEALKSKTNTDIANVDEVQGANTVAAGKYVFVSQDKNNSSTADNAKRAEQGAIAKAKFIELVGQ